MYDIYTRDGYNLTTQFLSSLFAIVDPIINSLLADGLRVNYTKQLLLRIQEWEEIWGAMVTLTDYCICKKCQTLVRIDGLLWALPSTSA